MGIPADAIFPASLTGLSTAIAEVSHRVGHYRSTASLAVRAAKRGGGESYNFSGGGSRGSASGGTPSESVGGSAGISGGTNYRAAEQYRYFRDYVYTAIRPIATRIAGQQVHVAVVTEQQMAKAFFAASRSLTSRDPAEHLFSLKRSLPDCFKQLGDNLEPIDDHPLKRILEWPNELMTGWAHIYTTVASLQLTGKANWWIDPLGGKSERRAGLPALWYMPVHWCEPKHGGGKLFQRWEVASPGSSKKTSVPGELMAYFSMPDPADPLSALAPLQSQAKAVATDEQIQTSQYASAKQGIRPGVIVKAGRLPDVRTGGDGPRPILTAEQRNQLYTAISMAHEGAMQHGRPLIVDGLIEEVFPFTSSPTDMDYPGGSLLTKSRIMQGFGVNPIVAGQIENANRASAAVADQSFADNVVNPLITLLSQTMTIALGSLFSGRQSGGKSSLGSRLVVWIEPARPRDDDLTLRQWTAAAAKGYVDEDEFRRFILNLPPKTDEQRQAELQRAQERMSVLSPGGGDAAGQPQGNPKPPPAATGNRNKPPKPKRTADQPGGKPDRKPSASSQQRQPVA